MVLLISSLAIFSLAAVATAAFAVWQARAIAGAMESNFGQCREEIEDRARSLDERLDSLAAQVQELERQPAITLAPGIPKPGMNVVKRAQALRLHRRGERPDQIATTLDLPRQEVDLLLKIHSIVLSNL
jgi:hypothetical protein